jgi:hypothetical protein
MSLRENCISVSAIEPPTFAQKPRKDGAPAEC